jgi:hypothetical protein
MKTVLFLSVCMLVAFIFTSLVSPGVHQPQIGKIDLTGDFVPEYVRGEGQRVAIYNSQGVEVWTSPPEWQVVDWALGDPNADGRNELFLAFWRQDESGTFRSHPFIIGYRGGIYRTLWGGSAVNNPILDIELSDVNGDEIQELIVLEQLQASRQRCITFWRWHGWGFSLVWRSPPGYYRNLDLIPREAKFPPVVGVSTSP